MSVLSAVEGLALNAPNLHRWVVPITVLIIVSLFLCQQWGTSKIGSTFSRTSTRPTEIFFLARKYIWSSDVPLVLFTVLCGSVAHSIESYHSPCLQSLRSHLLFDSREKSGPVSHRSVGLTSRSLLILAVQVEFFSRSQAVKPCLPIWVRSLSLLATDGIDSAGHFGLWPVRTSWFLIVLPSVMVNYLGQGAFLINHPESIENPCVTLALARLDDRLSFLA